MAKELNHRADELKQLGWNQEDLYKYIELWDYRQRWGSINLEREDRQFLRKAESLLPEISKNKVSVKKPLKQKTLIILLIALEMIGIQDFIQIVRKLYFNLLEMAIGKYI